jgi:hypothetical protein
MKSFLLPIFLVLTTALLLGGCSWFKKKETVENEQQKLVSPTPTPPETQLPPEERPVIIMTPDKDLHNVSLVIENLPADVATVDYELVYTSEGLQRGVIGTYSVSKGKTNLLLGSCSSGVCKYDQGITNGQLTIKYRTNGQRVLLREILKI